MAYSRTTWVSGETPLSAGNMNNIEDGIEELNSNKIQGPGQGTFVALTIENEKNFTAPRSGWIVCKCSTINGASPASFLEFLDGNGNPLNSSWGITAGGSAIRVAGPVMAGKQYRFKMTRCTLDYCRIHY